LHSLRQQETALELPRRNAAMQELAGLIISLAATNGELVLFHQNIELVARKACNCKRDAQALWYIAILWQSLDVVRRIAFSRVLRNAVKRPLDCIETEHERMGEAVLAGHAATLMAKRLMSLVTGYMAKSFQRPFVGYVQRPQMQHVAQSIWSVGYGEVSMRRKGQLAIRRSCISAAR
jgi:hypothetical protein